MEIESEELLTPSKLQEATRATNPLNPEQLTNFHKIRSYIEKAGLTQERKERVIETKNGGRVRVIYTVIDLGGQETQRPLDKDVSSPLVVSLMEPGLFESTPANTGNTEVKLAAGLFTGEKVTPNFIVFAHPEGLDKQAYSNGQKDVGEASASLVEELIQDYKETHGLPQDKPVEIEGVGYSEGSTKILSTIASLSEKFKINRVISIGGAGLIGDKKADQVNPISFVADAIKRANKLIGEHRKPGRIGKEIPGEMPDIRVSTQPVSEISNRLLDNATELLPIQEGGKGAEHIVPSHDNRNVLHFAERFISTQLGLKRDDPVPTERLKAACAYNDSVDTLMERNIPVLVLANDSDPFFASDLIHEGVLKLRNKEQTLRHRPANIWFVTGDFGHAGPHNEQTAINWLLRTLENGWNNHLAWQKNHL